MIQLHRDYLLFQISTGETIPCSAESMTIELVGDSISSIDPDVIKHASKAVLHYFKYDLGQAVVSIGEFTLVLERVLRGLGLEVASSDEPEQPFNVECSDLDALVGDSGKGFELEFFPKLREEMRTKLAKSPQFLRFQNLRLCVKHLAGAKRWNTRCQQLSDHIVDYLRECLCNESPRRSCGLIIV